VDLLFIIRGVVIMYRRAASVVARVAGETPVMACSRGNKGKRVEEVLYCMSVVIGPKVCIIFTNQMNEYAPA